MVVWASMRHCPTWLPTWWRSQGLQTEAHTLVTQVWDAWQTCLPSSPHLARQTASPPCKRQQGRARRSVTGEGANRPTPECQRLLPAALHAQQPRGLATLAWALQTSVASSQGASSQGLRMQRLGWVANCEGRGKLSAVGRAAKQLAAWSQPPLASAYGGGSPLC